MRAIVDCHSREVTAPIYIAAAARRNQVRPARSAPFVEEPDHGIPYVKKRPPALSKDKEETWNAAAAEEFKQTSNREDLAYVALSAGMADGQADQPEQDGLPDWTGFNQHIRKDKTEELERDIQPGKTQLDVVLTFPPIDKCPTSPEGILCVIELGQRLRNFPAEVVPLVLEPQPCTINFADGGEWNLLDQQIDGSKFEQHVFPM